MPTYEYECKNCGHFDAFQKMSDDALKICPSCGAQVRRLIVGGGGIIFKGSGFYVTDKSGRQKDGGADSGGKSKESADKSKESAGKNKDQAVASSERAVASSDRAGKNKTGGEQSKGSACASCPHAEKTGGERKAAG
jgi:putative FmdB family regulatory protein